MQVVPPLLVSTSGFSWSATAVIRDGADEYRYSTSVLPEILFLLLAFLPPLALTAKKKQRNGWRRVSLKRRYWRAALWGIGIYFLVLSGYWAWTYMLFYGVVGEEALVDPFLISVLGTFLLSAAGLLAMMLAVRSRGLWLASTDGRA